MNFNFYLILRRKESKTLEKTVEILDVQQISGIEDMMVAKQVAEVLFQEKYLSEIKEYDSYSIRIVPPLLPFQSVNRIITKFYTVYGVQRKDQEKYLKSLGELLKDYTREDEIFPGFIKKEVMVWTKIKIDFK